MGDRCPFCMSTPWAPGPVRGALAYRRCTECGSGYLAEAPIPFREYYEGYAPDLVATLPEVLVRRYHAMLKRLEVRSPGRTLLEVGCGNGHFMGVARERGWGVAGTELSRAHVERARQAGLDVRYGDVTVDRLFADRTFGAVVMIEVLEHVPEPRTLLAACASRLEPGGMLFLTTPNFGSVTRRMLGGQWSVLGEEHVGLASPLGLRRALHDTGYSVLRIRSKSLFLGDYRRLLSGRGAGRTASLSLENVQLRDRIEESKVLRVLKAAANAVLGATGLGDGMECWARRTAAPGGAP